MKNPQDILVTGVAGGSVTPPGQAMSGSSRPAVSRGALSDASQKACKCAVANESVDVCYITRWTVICDHRSSKEWALTCGYGREAQISRAALPL